MKLKFELDRHNILVIGDVMLDTYYSGDVSRISPEAPVPVFRKQGERSVLGGAANVAANLIAAGQNVSVMAIVGKDETGEKLKKRFVSQRINTDLLFSLNRHTTEKTRFLASNNQQVLRLDLEDTNPITDDECKKMVAAFKEKLSSFELILMSDYMKGLLTYDLTQNIIAMAKTYNIPVIIDVKDLHLEKYDGATLLKPNLKELQELTGMETSTNEQIVDASEVLRSMCHCDYVLTTCGSRGMVLVSQREPYFIKAYGREVFDVTGAGDTAIAYLVACLVNGYGMREAVDIANLAAGIQVSKIGTSAVSWNEIREKMTINMSGSIHKLVSGTQLDEFRKKHRDKKIVFTNGCFDILHTGHIRYLQDAAKLGDILIVGLNSDASVKRLKGTDRPINSEADRAEMLGALEFVDFVAVFEEDTPLELIKKIQPDFLVKGGDYSNEYVVGTNEVQAYGGKLVLIPFIEGRSTSNIIKKIRQKQ